MVKKSTVILGILAVLAMSAGLSWGYTVSKWPIPGIPNEVFDPAGACLPGQDSMLLGPVAPSCEPPLLPGFVNAGFSAPMRVLQMMTAPFFGGRQIIPGGGCCEVPMGPPAFVTAAVPCTAVNRYIPPCGF